MTEKLLPVGEMRTKDDGALVVRLRGRREEQKTARAWFDHLAALNLPWAMLPLKTVEGPAGLDLEYADETRNAAPLSSVTTQWGADLPASFPRILGLGDFTLTVAAEFARLGQPAPPLAPAFLRFVPGGSAGWRVVPLPTGEAPLAEWAKSDPDAWLWASSRSLLGERRPDAVYVLGAALHHGLVGALFAEVVGEREQFTRVLRGRVGLPSRLGAATRAALPRDCQAEAVLLAALILACLDPRDDRRPTEDEARKQFKELSQKLSPERLIRSWEYENRPEIVGRLGDFAKPAETPPPPPPPSGKDWHDQAEELIARGDLNAALNAAWNAVVAAESDGVHIYLWVARQIAARSPLSLGQAAAAVERLTQAHGTRLSEADFLHLTHLRMRYLNVPEQELGRLDRTYESRWNEGVAFLMRARLQVSQGADYKVASHLCRDGRQRFEAAPQGGGEVGAYARAYLHLLDGVAHVGYVGVSRAVDYYADALDHFGKAIDFAGKIDAADLLRASFRWLALLAQLTRGYAGPPLSLVHAGCDAILISQGARAADPSAHETPEIPWYDDSKIFPL